METKKLSLMIILSALTLVGFIFTIFWTSSVWLLLLTLVVLGVFAWSFFNPALAFIALVVIRTAADFLTDQKLFDFGIFSLNFTSFIGLVVLLFALVVFVEQKGWKHKIPLLIPWAIFLGLAFVFIFFSVNTIISLVEFLRWSSFLSLFILGFFLFPGGKNTTTLIKAVIFSSVIPTLVALIQGLNNTGVFDGDRWRVNGTFVHPNMLAFYLVFIITLALFIFLTLRKQAVEKYFYLLFSLPLILALGLTYTRGAWLCLFTILFLIGLIRFRIFLVSALFIISLAYIIVLPFQERVNSLFTFSSTDSTVWRLDLWRDALSYSKDNQLKGYGPGTSAIIIAQNRSLLLGSSEPHNDYIKIILETGLIGLAAYLFLITSLVFRLAQGFKQEIWPRRRLLFMFMMIFSFALYLFSSGDNILKDSSLQWVFWALNGALMCSYARLKKETDLVVE